MRTQFARRNMFSISFAFLLNPHRCRAVLVFGAYKLHQLLFNSQIASVSASVLHCFTFAISCNLMSSFALAKHEASADCHCVGCCDAATLYHHNFNRSEAGKRDGENRRLYAGLRREVLSDRRS